MIKFASWNKTMNIWPDGMIFHHTYPNVSFFGKLTMIVKTKLNMSINVSDTMHDIDDTVSFYRRSKQLMQVTRQSKRMPLK